MIDQLSLRLLFVIALTVTTQVSDNQTTEFERNHPQAKSENVEQTVTIMSIKNENDRLRESAQANQNIEDWLKQVPIIDEETPAAAFINTIGPAAVIIAAENGIYPSVMIAQAGLESAWGTSALAQEYNNLMGTKGTWQGNSVTMTTNEEQAGEEVQIDAGFSVYPSWADSLNRYGALMRNGLEWDANFYQGTWRENTDDYQEATAYLVGRYATDSSYADKLNATIERYNLNQFDDVEVLNFDYQEYLEELTVNL